MTTEYEPLYARTDAFYTANPDADPQVQGGTPTTRCQPQDRGNEPSLPDMTRKAIDLLDDDPQGFTLQVEGASIDKRDHAADVCGQIGETLAFDEAVGVALDYQRDHPDTLVIVTADHAHTSQMTYTTAKPAAGAAYATLQTVDAAPIRIVYGTADTGIGATTSGSQTHTGAQVPVWATGPQAANIQGTIDETDIFRVLNGLTPSKVTTTGAPGAAGPAGAPGAPGANGSNGSNGRTAATAPTARTALRVRPGRRPRRPQRSRRSRRSRRGGRLHRPEAEGHLHHEEARRPHRPSRPGRPHGRPHEGARRPRELPPSGPGPVHRGRRRPPRRRPRRLAGHVHAPPAVGRADQSQTNPSRRSTAHAQDPSQPPRPDRRPAQPRQHRPRQRPRRPPDEEEPVPQRRQRAAQPHRRPGAAQALTPRR